MGQSSIGLGYVAQPMALDDLDRPVCRAAVDNDVLELAVVVLLADAAKGLPDRLPGVVGGGDDRYRRKRVHPRAGACSPLSSRKSASTIIPTRSVNDVRGSHPSCSRAFDGSPTRATGSGGRTSSGSTTT